MSRNDSTVKVKADANLNEAVCSNCGGSLEIVGNRMFMMYKRARLPQPKPTAQVCANCGWVEGDDTFRSLLEQRIGTGIK